MWIGVRGFDLDASSTAIVVRGKRLDGACYVKMVTLALLLKDVR